ncbi:MAG: hypothetical protein RIT27_1847 [Pseudomonadota bacterium]|jgi:hypothetical protein
MQPIKLTVYGKYWDSQIYQGCLFLFEMDGSIKTLDWDKLFDFFQMDEKLKIAFEAAFKKSSLLYSKDNQNLMNDIEIKNILRSKFKRLQNCDLNVDIQDIINCTLNTQDNKFPFPHADSEIYGKEVYIASRDGVFSAPCLSKTKYSISTKLQKHWDAPCLRVTGSYGNIAIAAGNEGLYEKEVIGNTVSSNDPQKLSDIHCSDCNWNYYSIFGSSYIESGFLAYQEQPTKNKYEYDHVFSFNSDEDDNENLFNTDIIKAESIFGNSEYSWGAKDKICQITESKIKVYNFNPWKENKYLYRGEIDINKGDGDFVSAKIASFGTLIELDNALVILRSDDEITRIEGEPVNWRVFPRSKFYENQLHVIFDDRLEIYSFNHDYFVNQDKKLSGYKMRIA